MQNIRNQEIRSALKKAKISQWEIAEYMDIQECKFSRMMRHELPEEDKTKILTSIERMTEQRVRTA